jgi:hypothetical protein
MEFVYYDGGLGGVKVMPVWEVVSHDRHVVGPLMLAYLPLLRSVHLYAPVSFTACPTLHAEQIDLPCWFWCRPMADESHESAP